MLSANHPPPMSTIEDPSFLILEKTVSKMHDEIKHLLKEKKEFTHPDTGTIILVLIIAIAVLVGTDFMNVIEGSLAAGGVLAIHLLIMSYKHTKKRGFSY